MGLPVCKLPLYSDSNHIFHEINKHNPFSGHTAYLCRFEVVIFRAIQNVYKKYSVLILYARASQTFLFCGPILKKGFSMRLP